MPERAQRELFETAPRAPGPVIPRAEKVATREKQGGRCADCGGTSRGGHVLDVVRRSGRLVALCRSDRLRFDAPERRHPAQLRLGAP